MSEPSMSAINDDLRAPTPPGPKAGQLSILVLVITLAAVFNFLEQVVRFFKEFFNCFRINQVRHYIFQILSIWLFPKSLFPCSFNLQRQAPEFYKSLG